MWGQYITLYHNHADGEPPAWKESLKQPCKMIYLKTVLYCTVLYFCNTGNAPSVWFREHFFRRKSWNLQDERKIQNNLPIQLTAYTMWRIFCVPKAELRTTQRWRSQTDWQQQPVKPTGAGSWSGDTLFGRDHLHWAEFPSIVSGGGNNEVCDRRESAELHIRCIQSFWLMLSLKTMWGFPLDMLANERSCRNIKLNMFFFYCLLIYHTGKGSDPLAYPKHGWTHLCK